jgi:hypothetical protein
VFINPQRYDDAFEIKPSRFPCLRGHMGLFAKIDIPRNCTLGAYRGVFVPESDIDHYLSQHQKSKDYIMGTVFIRDRQKSVHGYLDPTELADYKTDYFSKMNSSNFQELASEQEFLSKHPGVKPTDYISSTDMNCKLQHVHGDIVSCWFIKTIKPIAKGEEIIVFYSGIWDQKLKSFIPVPHPPHQRRRQQPSPRTIIDYCTIS